MSLDEATISALRREWDSGASAKVGGPLNRPPPPSRALQQALSDDDYADMVLRRILERHLPTKDTGARELKLPPRPPVALVDGRKSNLDVWLLIPDCHIPFESKPLLDLVIEIGHHLRPHGIAVLGDFGDMLSVSAHPKLPHQYQWQLKDEVDAVNARLDQLDAIGATERVMCMGNHDVRGQRLAVKQMVGLYETLDPASLYKLKARGWKSYAYQQHVKVGKLWLVHDSGFSGRYAAHQNGDAFGASTVQGHNHQASAVYFGTVLGDRHVSCTLGWLGDEAYAEYMAPIKRTRSWQHAFGVAYVERDTQNTHLNLIPIVDGKCVVDGRLFEAARG